MGLQILAVSGASGFGFIVGLATSVSTAATSGLAAAPLAISSLADYFIDKAVEDKKISIKTAFIIKVSTLIVLTAATIAAGFFIVGPIAGALLAIPILIKIGFVCVSHYRFLKSVEAARIKQENFQHFQRSLHSILESLKVFADDIQGEFQEIEAFFSERVKDKDSIEKREASQALAKKKIEINDFITNLQAFESLLEEVLKKDHLSGKNRTELLSFIQTFVNFPCIFEDINFVETMFKAGVLHPKIITKRNNITESDPKTIPNEERMKFRDDQLAKVQEFTLKFHDTAQKLEQRTHNDPILSKLVSTSLSVARNVMSAFASTIDEIKNMTEKSYNEAKIKQVDLTLQRIYEILHNRVLMLFLEKSNIELKDIAFYEEINKTSLT